MPKSSVNPEGFDYSNLRRVSDMRSPYANRKIEPVALCMSDLHLSHKPPIWRSGELDWYKTMHTVFKEIKEVGLSLSEELDWNIPWYIAGDIFHKWNSPPSLINLAIDCLSGQNCIAIPGQHDLPNHLDEQYYYSPYATLDKAKAIIDVNNSEWEEPLLMYGYGWNTELEPNTQGIAMIHRYVWMDGCSYHGAPNTNKVKAIAEQLGNPKLIIAGDNHIGFWHNPTRTFNCGSLMRLNRDQMDYKPRIGIVYSDYSVIPYYLDTSFDVTLGNLTHNIMEIAERQDDVDEFLMELSQMGRGGLDYLDAVRRYCNKHSIRKATQLLIEQILTGDK